MCCSDYLLLSKASRTLNMAKCLLWQLSFRSPHVPSYTACTPLSPCSHASPAAVCKGMCQSLPGATFSAVAMVWTCFFAIFRSLLCLILLGGGSPYSKYSSQVSPFSKHFLPHSLSSLKLPLFDASAPSFDACSQRWLWRYHTRAVQCVAAVALTFCSLAHPACFRKALCTLFVYTDRTAVSPFRTSNVIRSVRSSQLLSSSEIVRPSSAGCQLAR